MRNWATMGYVVLVVGVGIVTASIPADINQDGVVNMHDQALLANKWLWETSEPNLNEMVFIPGGTFEMGDNLGDGGAEELPVHTVTVDSFYMGRYEITNQQYCDYLNSALSEGLIVVAESTVWQAGSGMECPYLDLWLAPVLSQIVYSSGVFRVRTKCGRAMGNDPVVEVTWYGAAAYCNWRSRQEGYEPCYDLATWDCSFHENSYRLPTEAEWEYAARGGLSGQRFPWGSTITHDEANYYSDDRLTYDVSPTREFHPLWYDTPAFEMYTSPVGSFPANGYSLYDMAGNVCEWCNDWYGSYSTTSQTNPTGPTSGTYRVLRGGYWGLSAYYCRVAVRNDGTPGGRGDYVGFRVVQSVAETVVVPDVVGMAHADAEATLAAARLVVGLILEEFSDTVPEGYVVSQTPLVGRTVPPGSAVNLVVSMGPGGSSVPDDMVLIPGGTFQMGNSFSEGYSGELPVHTVTVDSFYMGKYEITNQQYCDFLNSAKGQGLITITSGVVYKAGPGTSYPYCDTSTSSSHSQIAYNGSTFSVRTKSGRSMVNDPMVMVSWYGAAGYCNWLSQQLGRQRCYDVELLLPICPLRNGVRVPTEAEWELAARGGLSGRRFPWGDTITHSQANYCSSSSYSYDVSPTRGYHPTWNDGVSPYTSPVGSFPANGFGLHDMAGNVLEWCNDWYSSSYYSSSPSDNPTGPASGSRRVLRGGAWGYGADYCRVAFRIDNAPTDRGWNVGFHVVLDF